MPTVAVSSLPQLPSELIRFRTYGATYAAGADEAEVRDHLLGRLRFKDVTTFNDPFEARPHYVAAHSKASKQRDAMIQYLASIAPNERSMTARRKWAIQTIRGKGQQQIVDEIGNKQLQRDQSGNYFVFCLMHPHALATPLPWSHYADSHRGVCLHFDTRKLPINLANPVQYSDDYPVMKVPRTSQPEWAIFESVLLRKSKMWQYEREYRICRLMFSRGPARTLLCVWNGDVCLGASHVCRGITLGSKMPDAIRKTLVAWIRTHTPHVTVWQAELHRSKYQVLRSIVP